MDYYAQKNGVEARVSIEGIAPPLTPELCWKMERLAVEAWLTQQWLAAMPADTDAPE